MRLLLALLMLLVLLIFVVPSYATDQAMVIIGPDQLPANCSMVDGVVTCSDGQNPAETCGLVDGVWTCTDGFDAMSQYCTRVDGQLVCAGGSKADSSAHGVVDGTNAATVAASSMGIIAGWVTDFAEWLKGAFLFVPRWAFEKILEALSWIVTAIPVPDALTALVGSENSTGLLQQIPQPLVYVLDMFEFTFGVQMVFGALALRWTVRRLPFVGN